ncbi:MAG: AAA family ATPase [bacterium]|nr:AAA family ATPase [bacterium]
MLKRLTLSGFKSFGKKTELEFSSNVTAIVGPNGSGKSNVADAFRWVLGEQSFKSIRGKRGEDFIYHGSTKLPRSSTAQVVVTFDNANRRFDLDYDEVIISRKVFRDGGNEYLINNSKVRLRDVIELLAQVGVGASSHHIISQGEADRFLLAKPDERRVMIEDALGIKIYQYKKQESERKLNKTESNIKEVESLRRELAPHIKYLKKQVEKIEQAKELQETLLLLYKAHFRAEEDDIAGVRERLSVEREPVVARMTELEKTINEIESRAHTGDTKKVREIEEQIQKTQEELSALRNKKDSIYRSLGRLEGARAALARSLKAPDEKDIVRIRITDINDMRDAMASLIKEATAQEDVLRVHEILVRIEDVLNRFAGRFSEATQEVNADTLLEETKKLEAEEKEQENVLAEINQGIGSREHTLQTLMSALEKSKDAQRDDRLLLVTFRGERGELESRIRYIDRERSMIEERAEHFKHELGSAHMLVGADVSAYEELPQSTEFSKSEHEARWHKIERMKIRLEDLGGDSESTMREYEQITERDEHLATELHDLMQGAEKLRQLIDDLTVKLDSEFQEGVKNINSEFARFFGLLFGGGTAKLRFVRAELSEEEIELGITVKDGVDVEIDMPKKRVRSLQMLSGGERALTSLSLLFAIANVNPPPFMILDETDAALDEVNSKKYGDMVEALAHDSQLIIITHNRETMSHASVLYGVTMAGDGASKVFSIAFEEAKDVAER